MKDNLWQGFVPASEHPRLYNPESGIIVSANSLVTSKNCKNGISHAFSFTHRYLRIMEILEGKIKLNGKLQVSDMIETQLDTLDI